MAPGLMRAFRSPSIPTNLRASALSVLATCMEVSTVALIPWTDELVSGMIDLLRLETVSFNAPLPQVKNGDQTTKPQVKKPSVPGTAGTETEDSLAADGANEDEGARSANPTRHRAEDAVPALTISAKAPTLRRSALHFLSLLLKAFVLQMYNDTEDQNPNLAPVLTLPQIGSIQSHHSGLNFMSGGHTSQSSGSELPLDSDTMRRLGTVVRYVRDTDVDGIVRAQASECATLLDQLFEASLGGAID